jgi:hypothetical protein
VDFWQLICLAYVIACLAEAFIAAWEQKRREPSPEVKR